MKIKYPKPIPGDKFGNLTVLDYYHSIEDRRWMVDLMCNCGNIVKKIRLAHLYGSKTKSPIKNCKDCAYIQNGKEKRNFSDNQAQNAVWFNYQTSAKKRNLCWEIEKETFFSLIILPCKYCGAEKTSFLNNPKTSPWAKPFYYTGLDRIDSSKGYTLTNISPCCKICNRAKMDMAIEDFKDWLKKAYVKTLSE